ncbi:hypothetical protein [Ekhidna sp.]
MRIFEKVMIALFILGIVFQLSVLPGGALFIGISLAMLATIYFNFSFLLFNGLELRNIFKKSNYTNLNALDVIITFFAGLSLSIALVGVMFYLLVLPGSAIMLIVGKGGLFLCTVGFLILFLNKKMGSAKRSLIRIIPVLIICLWISTLEKYSWIEYRYREYPDYANAYKNALEAENIGVEEANRMYEILEIEREKMEEERNKRDSQ